MAKYQLLLPKMGESVAEATVIKWNKKPGDHVDADEAVMEIATDKVDSDVPSPVAGKLLEQFYQENDVVQVGAVIAIIETADAEPSIAKDIEPTTTAPETPEAHTFTEHAPAIEHIPFTEPVVVTEQPAAVVETPTFAPSFESEQHTDIPVDIPGINQLDQKSPSPYNQSFKGEGRFYSPLVRNIASQENISINELDTIPGTGSEGRLTKDDLLSYIQYKHSPAASPKTEAPLATATPPVVSETVKPIRAAAPGEQPVNAPVSPAPEPVIAAAPVLTAPEPVAIPESPKEKPVEIKSAAPLSSVSGADEIIEMDRMRRLIADHMVMSKQTSPHVTSFVEADVTSLVMWREKVKNSFEKREGEKITFTPIFIEAVVKAIKDFPMINVTVNGTQIIKKAAINISMATALPSGNLIVPVIKKADELNLLGITKAVNDLANRARNGKLLPDDVREGTFTITNVGSFGNVMGTPIINQPQVAILAVGAIKKKPAVIETPEGDVIAIRHMMFLSLSYDHRVVDGALGGSFVRRVADYLEKWDGNRVV
ncbi:dihydrolipoamide acetyltransferase family protein [Mucilaginibacter dorajii]|uniref:Dihydrolipoamide acetyltransferase component of pyruvate dehydrogenase complex n=1 Tax=Mucilaginibacter dorajii TaxID=692994 RepID=A0ABP7QHT7_9SPHI|nr:dihydrolipoamide acetyltransferase family protein [Mucilaginibacter dorajii]MCS3734280.1 2-oxoglutarate dehydrogenase E2 component (dihydrolipoamide succinyltransferase) [Mucilaginibacter dorajii]